jgi:hypothetical protein
MAILCYLSDSLEMGLRKFGASVEFGKGVGAAQEILLEGY